MSRPVLSPLAGLARYRSHGDNEAALVAALECARVVAVLDGWADAEHTYEVSDMSCKLLIGGALHESFIAGTSDAARAAAARAIDAGEV